jgi:uncharacterized OsmC-like protein
MSQLANLNHVDLDAVVALVGACDDDADRAQTVWQADVHWDRGFRSLASVRQFSPIASDEPSALGGTDTAPNPVEQVAAALGNCLAVGYVAALTGRGITIRELDIAVSGQLDLRPFLGLAPGHAGYSKIDVEVRIDSDADEATLQEVHRQVVSTSPVGHSLANPVEVDVRLGTYRSEG